jgi:hypothetical protein
VQHDVPLHGRALSVVVGVERHCVVAGAGCCEHVSTKPDDDRRSQEAPVRADAGAAAAVAAVWTDCGVCRGG